MNILNRRSLIKTVSVAVLILSFMVPLLAVGTAQACWWRRPLRASMNLNLDNMRPVVEGEPGYGGEFPAALTWSGYISGDINGYMQFFLTNYQLEGPNDEWGHFWETWQIFDEEGGVLLLEGFDEGYTHQAGGAYAMLGRVTYTGPGYGRWYRHIVFMHGTITPPPAEWGVPPVAEAPGTYHLF